MKKSHLKELKSLLKINSILLNDEEERKKIKSSFNVLGELPLVIAGPCSLDKEVIVSDIASFLNELEIKFMRGGAFKPRTSPYEFQGLGKKGISLLKKEAKKNGLLTVSEITNINDLDYFIENIDIIQVGARNMYNYELLKALGKTDKFILLKRGLSSTLKEWLLASEYILKGGNRKIIFCERGIRTYSDYTRNTLDISVIPIMKMFTPFPIIVDPSHASGSKLLITPLSKAALAVGADGIMVEVHPKPEIAFSDGHQTLDYIEFRKFIDEISEFSLIRKGKSSIPSSGIRSSEELLGS